MQMKVKVKILLVTILLVTLMSSAVIAAFELQEDVLLDSISMLPDDDMTIGTTEKHNKRPDIIENRIMGGDKVDNISEFCYQVGIQLKVGERSGWCGGSIISRDRILTAAHCFKGEGYIVFQGILYLGTINRDEPENGSLVIPFNSSDYIVHEGWDDKLKINDIALIKLKNPIQFSEKICLIDLVSNRDGSRTWENEMVLISGWGRSTDEPENYERDMRYAFVKVMNLEECTKKLWQARETNICVKSDAMIAACKGDSGGPLVYSKDGISFNRTTRRQIGVTSFTSRGCVHNYPRVYTKISSYLGWICKNADICEIIFPEE